MHNIDIKRGIHICRLSPAETTILSISGSPDPIVAGHSVTLPSPLVAAARRDSTTTRCQGLHPPNRASRSSNLREKRCSKKREINFFNSLVVNHKLKVFTMFVVYFYSNIKCLRLSFLQYFGCHKWAFGLWSHKGSPAHSSRTSIQSQALEIDSLGELSGSSITHVNTVSVPGNQ